MYYLSLKKALYSRNMGVGVRKNYLLEGQQLAKLHFQTVFCNVSYSLYNFTKHYCKKNSHKKFVKIILKANFTSIWLGSSINDVTQFWTFFDPSTAFYYWGLCTLVTKSLTPLPPKRLWRHLWMTPYLVLFLQTNCGALDFWCARLKKARQLRQTIPP